MSLVNPPTETESNEEVVPDVMAPPIVVTTTPEVTTPPRFEGVRTWGTRQEVRDAGAPVGLILAVFIGLLLSAWAAIVPFVGPTFSFSADGTSSWTWDKVHVLGALAPGVVGVLACVAVLASLNRAARGGAFSFSLWGFLLLLCGAWLTVVPVVWPVIAGPYFHAATPSATLEYWLGYASGPGVLLIALGALLIGRSTSASTLSETSTVTTSEEGSPI